MDYRGLQDSTEKALIRAVLNDPSGDRVRKCLGWTKAGVLTQPNLASILGELEGVVADGKDMGDTLLPRLADKTGLALQYIRELQDSYGPEDEHGYANNRELIHKAFLRRKVREVMARLTSNDEPDSIESAARSLDKIAKAARGGGAMANDRFSHLRFDPTRVLEKPDVVVSIQGVDVCTTGNLAMMTAEKKGGKSAVIGSILGATMKPAGKEGGDTFGITAENPDGLGVLHLDTEQCQYDHHKLVVTALRRAGIESLPTWVYSYGLLGESIPDILKHLDERLFNLKEEHGGTRLVLLDGVGDLVLDANDPKESATLVHHLQRLAVRYACAIICVLHLNPNSRKAQAKSRGHLGSILERKVEVDIRVIKDTNDISTIFTACSRREPIPEMDGPQFKWSPEQGMHMSTDVGRASQQQRKTDKLRILAEEVFEKGAPLKFSEIRDAIKRIRDLSQKSGERWFTMLREANVIVPSTDGRWCLAPSTPDTASIHPK